MAKQRVEVLTDDLTGQQGDDVATVPLEYDGVTYELELSKASQDKLDDLLAKQSEALAKLVANHETALSKYLAVARKVTGKGKGTRGSSPSLRESAARNGDAALIRAWAEENGIKVSARGRISAEVVQAYHATHGAVAGLKALNGALKGSQSASKRVSRPARVKGTKAQREDLLGLVRTFALNKLGPEYANAVTLENLTVDMVDAQSDGDVDALRDMIQSVR